MKRYIETQKTETYRKELPPICDKCGAVIHEGSYNAFNSECLEIKIGDSFPEGGSYILYTLVFCKDDALNLIDLLKASGYNVQKQDVDY
jgi:hypothetical protein